MKPKDIPVANVPAESFEVVPIIVILICHAQIQRERCVGSMIVLLTHLFIKVVSVPLSFCELSCDPSTCRHLQHMRIYLCISLCIIGHGGEPHWTDEHPQQDHWQTWVLFLHKHNDSILVIAFFIVFRTLCACTFCSTCICMRFCIYVLSVHTHTHTHFTHI